MATSCVPPDPFWYANRALAELLWKHHDGATVSTRIAEGVSATTRAPVRSTKTGLHGVASTAVGVAVGKASGSPLLGIHDPRRAGAQVFAAAGNIIFTATHISKDGGETQTIVAGLEPLVVLPDGRFLLFAADHTAIVHDALGNPTGATTPAFPNAKCVACLDGIVAGDKFSRDLGQTFEPLVPGGTLRPIRVDSYACNGSSLTLFISAPSPWIVQTSELGKLGIPKVFAFNPVMPQVFAGVQTKDGTTLAGNLAWKQGAPSWEIRIAPDAQLYALGDGSLFGFRQTTVYRSKDAGVTWTSTTSATMPQEASRFMTDAQHAIWASSGGATGSKIFRSDDDGVTWTTVSDKPYPAPELVAITADGTFVAKSFGSGLFVSHDRGATWTDMPFPKPYSLELVVGTDAVTWDMADDNALAHTWHLWHDYGLGNAYREITPTMAGTPIELGASGAKVQISDDGHAFLFGGGTLQGVFRSTGTF